MPASKKESKTPEERERQYPIARLSDAISMAVKSALEPMRLEVAQLKTELAIFTGLLNERRLTVQDPQKVFDLETALRAAGKWECGDQQCKMCTAAQQRACMAEKGVGPQKGG